MIDNFWIALFLVQLKGRVACEMGMNELLITELVLRNILTKLQPAEVSALLSALVFPPKKDNKIDNLEDLTPQLRNVGIEFLFRIRVNRVFV